MGRVVLMSVWPLCSYRLNSLRVAAGTGSRCGCSFGFPEAFPLNMIPPFLEKRARPKDFGLKGCIAS